MPLDNYLWEKSPKRRRIALTVNSKGELIVKTPLFTRKKTVEGFIREKYDWIKKQQRLQVKRIHPELPSFKPEGELYLLGEKIPFVCEAKRPAKVIENGSVLLIQAQSEALFIKVLTQWYLHKSKTAVEKYLAIYKNKIDVLPKSVGYKRYKRKWGSCDSKNNLMFNTLLAMHKERHIEYIVVHELAHIKEKHHQKAFWHHGAQLLDDFKKLHKDMIQ